MKKLVILEIACLGINSLTVLADTTWISTSSTAFITAGNWNNGLPSTGPQLAILADSATIQHTIDITGVTARNTIGIQFLAFAGGDGFTFGSSANNSPGFQSRAGGTASGVLNLDENTQTFNVSFTLFSSAGGTGAGAAQTLSASGGNLVFSGNHPTGRSTVNNNGGDLTIDGSHNTTIGINGATFGDLIGAGKLIKNGAGTLSLGGTAANTFSGGTVINNGVVSANKVNALGAGGLVMAGGAFQTGGLNQSLGTLDLDGTATIDFGSGASTLNFANSAALDWSSFTLNIVNWTSGSDTLLFGTDATGLTTAQLNQIVFSDLGNATGQIDANGFITPTAVPEPSSIALLAPGALGLAWWARRRRAA